MYVDVSSFQAPNYGVWVDVLCTVSFIVLTAESENWLFPIWGYLVLSRKTCFFDHFVTSIDLYHIAGMTTTVHQYVL
jgi:hypothetical protein